MYLWLSEDVAFFVKLESMLSLREILAILTDRIIDTQFILDRFNVIMENVNKEFMFIKDGYPINADAQLFHNDSNIDLRQFGELFDEY